MRAIAFPERNLNPTGPILRSMVKYAEEQDIDVIGFDDDFNKYDSIIVFYNRTDKMPDKKTSAKIGWWMCDLRPAYELGESKLKLDKIFLCNTEFAKQYEQYFNTKVIHMPQCGIEEEFDSIGRRIKWDAVFIGNLSSSRFHHNRGAIVEKIMEKYDVKIISGEKFTYDTKWLYSETPFSLSISPQAEGYTSNRTYNILSSKGFCLILWFPGIEKLFKNHHHLVWFKTPGEAIEIMDYYYEHPKEYDKIKEQGYKLYEKEHSAGKKLEEMFACLEKD